MKKALILAYDFPPYVSVGGLRPYSWYKYFYEFDVFPIVITRQWSNKFGNKLDYISSGESKQSIIEISETSIVIRTPYNPNFANKLMLKYGDHKFKYLRKISSAYFEIIQWFLTIGPKSNLYHAANEYLKKNKIDVIIATGGPFILFKYASKLSKNYYVPWIADYRDPWTQNKKNSNNLLMKYWNTYLEKKHLKNTAFATTVSSFFSKKISTLVDRPVYIISNGYDPASLEKTTNISQNENVFSIAFVGTIYNWHPFRSFLKAISEFILYVKNDNFRINFYGINIADEIKTIINEDFPQIEKYIIIYPTIFNHLLFQELSKNSLFLLFNDYSIIGTKIYDYLALRRNIMLCYSNDNEALVLKKKFYIIDEDPNLSHHLQEDLIKETNSGFIVKDSKHLKTLLIELYKEFLEKGQLICHTKNYEQFSRKNQTKLFAEIINSLKLQKVFIEPKPDNIRERIFKTMFQFGVHDILHKLKPQKNKIIVITFHRISDEKDYVYPPINPIIFEGIIKYICSHFEVTTFTKLDNVNNSRKPRLIITFDDGYKDFIDNALPILIKYNLPAVQNVVINSVETGELFWTQRLNAIFNYIYINRKTFKYSNANININYSNNNKKTLDKIYKQLYKDLLHVNDESRKFQLNNLENIFEDYQKVVSHEMMNWNDLKICIENNIEIGSHSISHDSLKTITDANILRDEILNSKRILEEKLGVNVISFAFPNGEYNKFVIEEAIKSGYKFLQTTQESFLDYNSKQKYFLVPRYQLYYNRIYENIFKINNFHNIYH